MAAEVPLTLHQGNDEVLLLTITRNEDTDDLTGVETIEVYLKGDQALADDDENVIKLSSTDASKITIDSKVADQITARVVVSAAHLAHPYVRWWRADAIADGTRRTAVYGPVTVVPM